MFGFSLYSQAYSTDYIQKMLQQGVKEVFISLHILEELENKANILQFLTTLQSYELDIIADISPVTLKHFSLTEIKSYGINSLRLDFGFTMEETINLMKEFSIILNASTLSDQEISYLQNENIELSNITLMHNFYPKEETGLSYETFISLNKKYKEYGFKILTFVPGDGQKRGPIYRGLPTIEKQRYQNFLTNCVELLTQTDKIFIADNELKDKSIEYIKYLNNKTIPLKILYNEFFDLKFLNTNLKLRRDSNHLNWRIEDSRFTLKTTAPILANNCINRPLGTITIDNILSNRYNGELMITRTNLDAKENLNVVGEVVDEYKKILKFDIKDYKIVLIPDKN